MRRLPPAKGGSWGDWLIPSLLNIQGSPPHCTLSPPPPYLLSLSSEPWILCLMVRLPGTAAAQEIRRGLGLLRLLPAWVSRFPPRTRRI